MQIRQLIRVFAAVSTLLICYYLFRWIFAFLMIVDIGHGQPISWYASLCFRYFCWGWAALVWGYALAWFSLDDRVKLMAHHIFDMHKTSLLAKSSR